MSKSPVVSCIINVHNEPIQWIARSLASVVRQKDAPDYEIIVVADKCTDSFFEDVRMVVGNYSDGATDALIRLETTRTEHGDLGLARNSGRELASGKYVQFLDGDDLLGFTWLRDAYEYIKRMTDANFVLHPEFNGMFGAAQFIHRHVGDDSPEFSQKALLQFNAWSALAFAPKSVLERFPYEPSDDTFTNEDWAFNLETIAAGIKHRVVPGSAHFIRMKLDKTSMSARMTSVGGVQRKRAWFDRRDLKEAEFVVSPHIAIPPSVHKQALFAHHEIGERQIMIDPQPEIRTYPESPIWNDQAFLRDAIGDAKHVVVVQTLPGGGAEKFGLNWAKAIHEEGWRVAVIETAPEHVEGKIKYDFPLGYKEIQWRRHAKLVPENEAEALQRALIQCELDSVFICNSQVGLMALSMNPKCLAKRVFVSSFARIPQPNGFSSAPPYWFKRTEGFTVITDNERHAREMHEYNGVNVRVIRPKAEYTGQRKLRQVLNDSSRLRVLWAGRGTPDKQPNLVADLALHMPEADFHVWGDVPRVPNALPNLKYRGPFASFDAIDGTYDCWLSTSINEGLPHGALEACLAGLPVVAPDVGDLGVVAERTFPMQIGKPVDLGAIIEALKFVQTQAHNRVTMKVKNITTWADEFNDNVKALVIG